MTHRQPPQFILTAANPKHYAALLSLLAVTYEEEEHRALLKVIGQFIDWKQQERENTQ